MLNFQVEKNMGNTDTLKLRVKQVRRLAQEQQVVGANRLLATPADGTFLEDITGGQTTWLGMRI